MLNIRLSLLTVIVATWSHSFIEGSYRSQMFHSAYYGYTNSSRSQTKRSITLMTLYLSDFIWFIFHVHPQQIYLVVFLIKQDLGVVSLLVPATSTRVGGASYWVGWAYFHIGFIIDNVRRGTPHIRSKSINSSGWSLRYIRWLSDVVTMFTLGW